MGGGGRIQAYFLRVSGEWAAARWSKPVVRGPVPAHTRTCMHTMVFCRLVGVRLLNVCVGR